MRKTVVAKALAILLIGVTTSSYAAYEVKFLDAVGGLNSAALDINDSGQIVGWSHTAGGTQHATLWSGATTTDLGSGLSTWSIARAINSSGDVAGISAPINFYTWSPVLWKNGTTTVLPNAPTQFNEGSDVYGINNAGIIVGTASTYPLGSMAATWNGQTVTTIPSQTGRPVFSEGRGINNSGDIVGYADTPDNEEIHANVWRNGVATDLGTLGGKNSYAMAINDAGIIVGGSTLKDQEIMALEAVMWVPGQQPMRLPSLGGPISEAFGLNEIGQVVGLSTTGVNSSYFATLWDNGKLIDLNTYLSAADIAAGWILNQANAINESGWIVGLAHNTISGIDKGFLLSTPVVSAVPEPETYLMMLGGLGMMGFISRRRKKSESPNKELTFA